MENYIDFMLDGNYPVQLENLVNTIYKNTSNNYDDVLQALKAVNPMLCLSNDESVFYIKPSDLIRIFEEVKKISKKANEYKEAAKKIQPNKKPTKKNRLSTDVICKMNISDYKCICLLLENGYTVRQIENSLMKFSHLDFPYRKTAQNFLLPIFKRLIEEKTYTTK